MSCGRKLGPLDCCSVVEGDALELLRALPPASVDTVITSPPYNLGTTTGGGFPVGYYNPDAPMGAKRGGCGKWSGGELRDGYGIHDDAMPHVEYVAWQHSVLSECWRVIPQHGAIFYNHKPRVLGCELVSPLSYAPTHLTVRQIVIWARAGGVNFSPAFYVPTHEWVVIFAKRDFRLRDKSASGAGDVWYIPQEPCSDHPAPFPEALPRTILETTTPGIVLDPFGGRGTTACAAKRLGRHYLTFDNNPQFCRIARERIALVEAQPSLFAPQAEQLSLDSTTEVGEVLRDPSNLKATP